MALRPLPYRRAGRGFLATHDAHFHERSRPALLGACFILLIWAPTRCMCFFSLPTVASGRGFRHPPKMKNVQTVLIESTDQAFGRRGFLRHAMRTGESNFQRPGWFEGVKDAKPDGGHATGKANFFLNH